MPSQAQKDERAQRLATIVVAIGSKRRRYLQERAEAQQVTMSEALRRVIDFDRERVESQPSAGAV